MDRGWCWLHENKVAFDVDRSINVDGKIIIHRLYERSHSEYIKPTDSNRKGLDIVLLVTASLS